MNTPQFATGAYFDQRTGQVTIDNQGQSTYVGSRPLKANKRTGQVLMTTERGVVVNSLLRRDEWQQLDAVIHQAAHIRLTAVNDLRTRGLVSAIGSLGTLTTQWTQSSEMTAANVSMTGRSTGNRDRVDNKIVGRPVPITFKEFDIGKRELEASRILQNPVDMANASDSAIVVAEALEGLLVNGDTSVIFGGDTLYGYTTEPNRNTDTAANYGGGDWGTLSNVVPTVSGMIAAANADRYFRPYVLYASTVQYNQANTNFFTDGSGQNGIQRLLQIDSLEAVRPCDTLADGNLVLVQMTPNVVEWAEHMGITVVEWMSGDGMTAHFKVMAVATPKVKSDHSGGSGIVHATGA